MDQFNFYESFLSWLVEAKFSWNNRLNSASTACYACAMSSLNSFRNSGGKDLLHSRLDEVLEGEQLRLLPDKFSDEKLNNKAFPINPKSTHTNMTFVDSTILYPTESVYKNCTFKNCTFRLMDYTKETSGGLGLKDVLEDCEVDNPETLDETHLIIRCSGLDL